MSASPTGGHWRLVVSLVCGDTLALCGTEELMREGVEEWKQWLRLTEAEQETDPVLIINGYHDTADRAENQLIIRFDLISCMTITMMYR